MWKRNVVGRLGWFAVAIAVGVSPSWARSARSEADRTEPVRVSQRGVAQSDPDGSIRLDLDRETVTQLLRKRRVVLRDFPLPDRLPVDLDLKPFDVLAPGARLIVVDEHGEREVPRPSFQAYRGTVLGDPDSSVTLSVFEGRIAGSIHTWDDEFVIAPRRYNLAREGSREIRAWSRDGDPDQPDTPLCGADADPTYAAGTMLSHLAAANPVSAPSTQIDGNTLLAADIAVDATYEWYAHFGSVAAAQSYILNLMAQVSTIYENEVRVQLEVPYIRIFQTPADPYTDGETSTSVLLDELRAEWNANQTAVDRTVAHLFSVRPSGGSGRAYLDVLCDNDFRPGNSADYGVSTLSANGGSWEKNLVAHELGHNFSSPHTHCYVPEIDQCANQSGCYQGATVDTPSTIMSYCSQIASSFHVRVQDEKIRPAAEAAFPTCIDTAGLPGRLQDGGSVSIQKPEQCPSSSFVNDDGSANQYYGYGGSAQMAYVKRYTPSCYPFLLEQVDVMIGSSTVAVGRPVRVLVYTDPAGSGDIGNATLVHSEDSTVQVVSLGAFNQYVLSSPVTLTAGDYYIGIYDLDDDAATTYLSTVDFSTEGDSYRTANSTSPQDFQLHSGGTWMIRGAGGPVGLDSLMLQWGAPCNDATTPSQDFAVYQGVIGDFSNYASLTCSTGRDTGFLDVNAPANSFYLVVPRTSANEGSYGLTGESLERAPAAASCVPQSVGGCL